MSKPRFEERKKGESVNWKVSQIQFNGVRDSWANETTELSTVREYRLSEYEIIFGRVILYLRDRKIETEENEERN